MILKAAELAHILNLLAAEKPSAASIDLASKLETELKRISPAFYRQWKSLRA